MEVNRKQFIKKAAAGIAALAALELGSRSGLFPLTGSRETPRLPGSEEVLGKIPADPQARQILRMSELNRLPWFDYAGDAQLRLKEGAGVPKIIDCHTHVGWSQGFGDDIDMTARNPVRYFWDYEITQDFLNFQLHPTPKEAEDMTQETKYLLFRTPERNKSYTAANLTAEMERFNHVRSILLPIEIPLYSRHAEQTRRAAKLDSRLTAFTGIHPWHWSHAKEDRLAATLDGPIRGLKFHPVFQFMGPDHPDAMRMFAWCAENNVVVLAHTGYTGSEPEFMRALSEPERYETPLKAFPKLRIIFAHTGSRRRFHETLAVARRHEDQVWLEFSGQPVPHIQIVLDTYDPAKIVYGSDWPYYPLSVSLARFLVATEGRDHLRQAILYDNAARLLNVTTA